MNRHRCGPINRNSVPHGLETAPTGSKSVYLFLRFTIKIGNQPATRVSAGLAKSTNESAEYVYSDRAALRTSDN